MKRLQGQEWIQIKQFITEILGYYQNENTKRIKVFVKTRYEDSIIYHWLSDVEREKFEENKHKYSMLDNSGKVIKEVVPREKLSKDNFYDLCKDKGLSPKEINSAYNKYTEICGTRWDLGTALEIISSYT